MPSPTDAPASLPAQIAAAEGELPTRLRIIADGDLRTMARDSLVGIHPDQHELHEWADLMDEAADALTAAESAREAAVVERDAWKDQAENWQATAQAEAEIGNERRAEADAALARAERAEKALGDLLAGLVIDGGDPDVTPDPGLEDRLLADPEGEELAELFNVRARVRMLDLCRRIVTARAALAHPAPAEET